MNRIQCEYCNQQNEASALECRMCGAPLGDNKMAEINEQAIAAQMRMVSADWRIGYDGIFPRQPYTEEWQGGRGRTYRTAA